MAGTITITDNGQTLNISDGNISKDIIKPKLSVFCDDLGNVHIKDEAEIDYVQPASAFLSPSGTAVQIQAAIAAMMPIS